MFGEYKRMSLKNRITLLSLVLVLLVSSTLSFGFYRNIVRDMEESTSDYSNSLSLLVLNHIEERVYTIITHAYSMTIGKAFQQRLLNYLRSDDEYLFAQTATYMNETVELLLMSDSFVNSAYLYTPKGIFYSQSKYIDPGFDFLTSELYSAYCQNGSPRIFNYHRIENPFFRSSDYVIPIIIRVELPGYSQNVFLILNVDSTTIESYLSTSLIGGEDVLVVNTEMEPVASSNMSNDELYLSTLVSDGDTLRAESKNYITNAAHSELIGWTVITFLDRNNFTEALQQSRMLFIIIILSSLFLTGILARFFSRRMVVPLEQLEHYMNEVTNGNYDPRFTLDVTSETAKLAECFNTMAERVGALVGQLNMSIEQLEEEKNNLRIEQSLKRKAELAALQAQIKPHFLYNTLNSIIWLAAETPADLSKIQRLSSELSKFYAYRINSNKTLIYIRDEIEQVKSYVYIQAIRFGSEISYRFNVDPATESMMIAKLSLQPLVENALFHGIQGVDLPGEISVSVKLIEDEILVEVHDNGAGIPAEELSQINSHLKIGGMPQEGGGYGIYNVNERLKLSFGARYGIWYESSPGFGTSAFIRIPAISEGDETED